MTPEEFEKETSKFDPPPGLAYLINPAHIEIEEGSTAWWVTITKTDSGSINLDDLKKAIEDRGPREHWEIVSLDEYERRKTHYDNDQK